MYSKRFNGCLGPSNGLLFIGIDNIIKLANGMTDDDGYTYTDFEWDSDRIAMDQYGFWMFDVRFTIVSDKPIPDFSTYDVEIDPISLLIGDPITDD